MYIILKYKNLTLSNSFGYNTGAPNNVLRGQNFVANSDISMKAGILKNYCNIKNLVEEINVSFLFTKA